MLFIHPTQSLQSGNFLHVFDLSAINLRNFQVSLTCTSCHYIQLQWHAQTWSLYASMAACKESSSSMVCKWMNGSNPKQIFHVPWSIQQFSIKAHMQSVSSNSYNFSKMMLHIYKLDKHLLLEWQRWKFNMKSCIKGKWSHNVAK